MPANGSKSVALDIGVTSGYLGQFNLNYNTDDGIQRVYKSSLFTVNHDLGEISQTVTWNQQALSTPQSRSTTLSNLQATSTGGSLTTSATTTTLTSTPTSTAGLKASNSTPHRAAAIGLGVGISFGVAAMGLLVFLFWKRNIKSDRRRSKEVSQKPTTFPDQEKFVGEMDAYQKHPEIPVGRLDAELDGSRSALQGGLLQNGAAVRDDQPALC